MTPIFSYFLQGSFVTFMFLLFYKLLLRKDTFFKWGRWYFLCAVIASFLLPLVDVSFLLYGPTKQAIFVNYIPDLSFSAITVEENVTHEIFYNLLFAGIIVMSMRLILQMKALVKLRKNKKINKQANFKIVELEERINPFSFFNEIYINPLLHTDAEMHEIIQHEQFHIEQKHTLDILLGEALTIAFWFNPFAWLLKNELKQNLEYLTDKLVLQSGIDAKHYQYNLLKVSGLQNNIAAANHFHFLKLKNRIIMMNKQQSKPYRLAKYLLLVPVVAVMLMAFSQRKQLMEAMNTIAVADTIPVPTPPSVDITVINSPTDPVAPKDKPLPADVKQVEVNKSNGTHKITITLKNGKKEMYNMKNAEEKKAFEKKYGEWTEPTAPLAPLSPLTPPSAPIAPLSPIAPISEPYLSADIKSMNVTKKDGANKISLELKNGNKEEYDLNNANDKKRFEEKYGPLNPPPPPPPPIEKKKTALNEKGFYLSVADDAGECVIIVKDKNKKILEALRLTDWDAAKSIYERKYGKVPELKETTVQTNTNASKDGPGNPYTSVKINSTINYSNSVNLNNELVIVDGVEQPKGVLINNIDVNTIESISVLKDKSAVAIYGEKGKNGVIIIKTKKAVKTASPIITGVGTTNKNNTVTITGTGTNSNTTTTSTLTGDYKDALVIVDGKEMTTAEMDLKIKPEQIKSIHILKGEAAIKKFGDKGKNGVIEIELK